MKSTIGLFKLYKLIAAILCLFITSCSGCQKDNKSNRRGPEGVAPSPTPNSVDDVGEDVPPITNDKPSVIDTSDGAALKHLIFESTASKEANRHLSEYLIVIRASEESCVRLKVRSTDGLDNVAADEILKDGVEGTGACAGQKINGEEQKEKNEKEEKEKEKEEEKALALTSSQQKQTPPLTLDWIDSELNPPHFALTAQNYSLCSSRLFRMEANRRDHIGLPTGLGKVVEKTGQLLVIGDKVRIWLDTEFANVCFGGSALDTRSPIKFAQLIADYRVPNTWADKLWTAHLQNLADEMDKIYKNITSDFGPISDIDKSGYVEVFLSPEVNRGYFDAFTTHSIDHFKADFIYRPHDLAYYNSETNPISNEGEIAYLWTPDAGGIYNYVQYPSSNSISSNYAKGYLTAQLMTLVIANEKLFTQKLPTMEEQWLVEGLAGLASGYYAGNEFAKYDLSQYLTSRPQYLNLTGPLNKSMFSERYLPMAMNEQFGLRTLFAWYMHATKCGTKVAPCKKLKDLITTAGIGVPNVEKFMDKTITKILENFGLSVGIALADKPNNAYAYWNKSPLPDDYPPPPTKLPPQTETTFSSAMTTEEIDNVGTLLGGSKQDRSKTGPFPSTDTLLFQPIAPDHDLEFKVDTHSVTYILVTGLIEKSTDVTAFFGKGLNVVFVPLGERDSTLRRVHYEKVSENAHSDLRPDNLTSLVDPDKTYNNDPFYDSLDYSVTPSREIWIQGSIDNYTINVEGALKPVGDSDAYNIEIQPCAGLTGTAKTTCEAEDHQVMIQTHIRDHEKELAPMLLITAPERKLFRGASMFGRLEDVTDYLPEVPENTHLGLCQAASGFPIATASLTSAVNNIDTDIPHGLTTGDIVYFRLATATYPQTINIEQAYTATVVDADTFTIALGGSTVTPSNTVDLDLYKMNATGCANAGVAGKNFFDDTHTAIDPTAYAHTYDNLLMMGRLGFPFTTYETISYADSPDCTDFRCYFDVENIRQHLVFQMSAETKAQTYILYPSTSNFTTGLSTRLTTEEVKILAKIKRQIESGTCVDPQSEDFIMECETVANLNAVACTNICGASGSTAENIILNYTSQNNSSVSCATPGYCQDEIDLLQQGTFTQPWIDPNNFHWFKWSDTTNQVMFYQPNEPVDKSGYCGGQPGVSTTQSPYSCVIKDKYLPKVSDIRQQFYTLANKVASGLNCLYKTLGTDVDVCIDDVSIERELDPDDGYEFWFLAQNNGIQRARIRNNQIYGTAGEIVAKAERLQAGGIKVPGTGGVVNIIVGGRGLSQGKYLIRARITDFE